MDNPVDNVVVLPVVTSLPLDPTRVLGEAMGQVTKVVIFGVTETGEEYFASSISDGADILWMMERARHKLMLLSDS